ncbi:MAG: hypothetical protein ND895_16335 [Pyrinomonadaceae bacterium]|nr:hypothetical protein [Pyrinomonadaceae bacterium]
MPQKPDRLLKAILILTSFSMIVVWLPLIRGVMDGNTYEWGLSFLGKNYGGRGLGGQYWLVVLQAVIAVALVYLGWRGARQPFHWLLLAWNSSGAVNAFYNAIYFAEDYRFQGDSLGVNVSVAWVGPLFWTALTLLSILWVVRDLKRSGNKEMPAWTGRNWMLLAITASLLPIQFLLLRFGEPHGTRDQIGVILTMVQWLLLNHAFAAQATSHEAGG